MRSRVVGTMLGRLKRPWLRAAGLADSLRAPHSRLYVVSDHASWALDAEAAAVTHLARLLDRQLGTPELHPYVENQSMFYLSQFVALQPHFRPDRNRVALAYYHGRPGTGVREFDQLASALKRQADRIRQVQVTHARMRNVALECGFRESQVFLIPIGVWVEWFPVQTAEARERIRGQMGIPRTAVVVGNFQKDGVGWGEGLEPKLIKGPDTLLAALRLIRARVPSLFVLLSGPARGYVMSGLVRDGIPFKHLRLKSPRDVAALYQALDLYIVSSREEGGPKAVLEAMASGVPLISTRVGQAEDLVVDGENGRLCAVGDAAGLADAAIGLLDDSDLRRRVVIEGRLTADTHDYLRQIDLWRPFFENLLASGGR